MRAAQLNIIPQQSLVDFYRFGPGKAWRSAREEPWDKELGKIFPESHYRFRQLVYRAYGEELITLSQAASYLDCDIDEANKQLNSPFDD